jgi:hypothetical protein
MSNITIEEAIKSKVHAEEAISKILTGLVCVTGAVQIAVTCRELKEHRFDMRRPNLSGVDVSIKLEF